MQAAVYGMKNAQCEAHVGSTTTSTCLSDCLSLLLFWRSLPLDLIF